MVAEGAAEGKRKDKRRCIATPRCYIAIIVGLTSMLTIWWHPWQPDSTSIHNAQHAPISAQGHASSSASSPGLASPSRQSHFEQQLAALAYHGNLTAIQRLMHNHSHIAWDVFGLTTPLHHALRGRFDSLQEQSSRLLGSHEDVMAYLMGERGLSASQGCPVYYAVNYRNMVALDLLLKASDVKSSVMCLTTKDASGVTSLHIAAESKASGFARFFAKLGDSDPSKDLSDLLGVRSLKISKITGHPGVTLQELNAALPPQDLGLILKHLRSVLDLMEVKDSRGNSLLHSATYGGRNDVVELLLKEGMSPDVVNHLNMTPLHLAYAGHFCSVAQTLLTAGADPLLVDVANRSAGDVLGGSECVDGQVKKELNPPPPPREDPVSVVMWNRYLGSGWYSGLHNGVGMRCDFPVRNVTMSTEEFVLNHTSIYRPALVRGVIQNWPAWEHWTYSELQRRYGSLVFSVSDVPYAQLYHGRSAKTRQTTLADYVSLFEHEEESPDYLFDGQVLHHNTVLGRDAPPPSLIVNFTITLKQLIVGPKGSGSPPHFHNHALNALVYGVKRWFMWPPHDAHFIFGHVSNWAKNRTGNYLECVQKPGDVVYVPQNWGHAVINEAPSIAVAYEFSV